MTRMWLGAVLLVAPAATAQEQERDEAPAGRPIRYKDRTDIVFGEEVEVHGETMRPGVSLVHDRRLTRGGSLVWHRTDWNDAFAAASAP